MTFKRPRSQRFFCKIFCMDVASQMYGNSFGDIQALWITLFTILFTIIRYCWCLLLLVIIHSIYLLQCFCLTNHGTRFSYDWTIAFFLTHSVRFWKNIYIRRQDHKAAVRRVVQPKMVTASTLSGPHKEQSEHTSCPGVDQETDGGGSHGKIPDNLVSMSY